MKNQIYIVIINFNSYKDTVECLESILKQDFNNYQIIVVDNSSSDAHLNQINEWSKGNYKDEINTQFPEIIYPLVCKPIKTITLREESLLERGLDEKLILVKAKHNNGFAAANNIGLSYINKFGKDSDLIWLLNNDTIIAKKTISDIVKAISESKFSSNVIYGTPLIEYYDRSRIQAIGGKYNKYFGLTSHIGAGLPLKDVINVDKFKVDYPIGASMIVTKRFLNTVGLLNEEYFLFYEELDWMMRLKNLGGVLKILNIFGVYHKQGSSTNIKTKQNRSKSEFIDLLFIKNRILFSKKYFVNHTWSVILFILTVTAMKRLLSGNLNRVVKIYKLVF